MPARVATKLAQTYWYGEATRLTVDSRKFFDSPQVVLFSEGLCHFLDTFVPVFETILQP